MAKKVKSYSLSEEAINKIKRIYEEKGYKSESDCLDAIILGKETDVDRFKSLILEVLKENHLTIDSSKTNMIVDKTTSLEDTIKDEVEENLIASMKDMFKNIG